MAHVSRFLNSSGLPSFVYFPEITAVVQASDAIAIENRNAIIKSTRFILYVFNLAVD